MSTEKSLNNLVINKVESQEVYNYMKANSLINEDELYLVEGTNEIDIPEATTTTAGLMSAADKARLDGLVATGGEANQNAFSNVVIGDKIITADNTTDTFIITAGDNITLTPDEDNNGVTITSKDTIYTHPSYASKSSGLYKITVDDTGHVVEAIAVTKDDITAFVSEPVAITTEQIDAICGATIYAASEVNV